jgi:hypothetical protein
MTSKAADAAARSAAKPTAAAASAEPSVPTTTRCSGPTGRSTAFSFTTITGQRARAATVKVTEPSSAPTTRP